MRNTFRAGSEAVGQLLRSREPWRELESEWSRPRGHNEGTSLREDAGYDEKC